MQHHDHASENNPEAKMSHAGGDHHDHHAHMAADFQKRFWISLVLTLPIILLSPMLQKLVGLREVRCGRAGRGQRHQSGQPRLPSRTNYRHDRSAGQAIEDGRVCSG